MHSTYLKYIVSKYEVANKRMKGHSESAYFAKLDLQTEWFTL